MREFITGFLIGLANLIPGVSGGTFALILGVYERLITFLNNVNPASLIHLVGLCLAWLKSGFGQSQGQQLSSYLKEKDYPFMAVIGLGAIVCIVAMSSVMKYLLLYHFVYTYAYFFGLIILSVIIPWRMIRSPRPLLLLPILAGILLTVFVTASVNPYEKALNKSQLLEDNYQIQQSASKDNTDRQAHADTKLSYVGKYSTGEFFYIFICGVVAISAMVLPGVSGSLVLILMNQYFAVISALSNLSALLLDDLLFLFAMGLGIVFGLLSFARFIEYAFKKFHDPMVCFLVGLIAGSLYSLWPYKHAEIIPFYYVKEGSVIEMIKNHTVYSNINILPQDPKTILLSLAAVVAGMITMAFFLRQEGAK